MDFYQGLIFRERPTSTADNTATDPADVPVGNPWPTRFDSGEPVPSRRGIEGYADAWRGGSRP